MAEADRIIFTYKEIAECLVKKHKIPEGIWGIYIKFGIQAANAGPTPENVYPTAFVPVLEIGLQKMDVLSNIAVDAAEVMKPKGGAGRTKKKSRTGS